MKLAGTNKKFKIALCLALLALGLALIGTALFLKFGIEETVVTKVFSYLLDGLGAISIFVGLGFGYKSLRKNSGGHKLTTREITMIGIQSALTVILYYFLKFNLPFFPPWLDIQFSELPALITTFAYGPYAGSLVILVRFIMKLPASITAGVGEAADLILGVALVVITGYIYSKHRTIKGALVGVSIGVGFCTVLACVLNWLVLIPAYVHLAHFSMEALAGMMKYLGNVTVDNFMLFYIFAGVLPFNIFRYILVALLTFVLYKKTHVVLNKLTNVGTGRKRPAAPVIEKSADSPDNN